MYEFAKTVAGRGLIDKVVNGDVNIQKPAINTGTAMQFMFQLANSTTTKTPDPPQITPNQTKALLTI